jgi:tripartite-type tricarboxylate transporter receptor subunit TctC
MRKGRLRAPLLFWLLVLAASAIAQDYPSRPIKFIVPYPPGGGTDVVARIVNEPLATELGQPIIIDNRGGAAGNLGTDIVAKSPADGYTILFTLSSHTINPKLYEKLPFDVERDFVPVSLVAMVPQILVVNPSVPITSVKELIAYAKANPGKLNYASVGIGSPAHRGRALEAEKPASTWCTCRTRGGAGGRRYDRRAVQLAFVSMPAAWQHVKSGLGARSVSRARSAVPPRPRCPRSPSRAYRITSSTRGSVRWPLPKHHPRWSRSSPRRSPRCSTIRR